MPNDEKPKEPEIELKGKIGRGWPNDAKPGEPATCEDTFYILLFGRKGDPWANEAIFVFSFKQLRQVLRSRDLSKYNQVIKAAIEEKTVILPEESSNEIQIVTGLAAKALNSLADELNSLDTEKQKLRITEMKLRRETDIFRRYFGKISGKG